MYSEGTSLKEFKVIDKLGEGSFSCVYKVQRLDDSKVYAMKKVKINQMKEKEKENALNEVRILASITHPNIVNYKEAFFDDKTQALCVVMELADAGDIQKKINDHKATKTHFNEVEIWRAMIQMAKGLKALHEIKILHRDLKCANVFCTKQGKYKLGDMNVSKVAKRGMARTQTGTPYYTSPQVWNDKAYDSKCDIWSLGCVVYEMAALNPPFRANNLKELYTKIQKGIYPNIPPFYSEDLKNIISQCLKVNSSHRPSAVELLQNSKVVRNMPSSEAYNQENNQTSKAALLKTILVPKNMRQLKEALPGSNYDEKDNSSSSNIERKYRRVNSAQNLRRNETPSSMVIAGTPKAGDNAADSNKYNLKYALMRRPSANQLKREHQDPKSEIRDLSQRNNSSNSNVKNNVSSISHRPVAAGMMRMKRNNSVDYIRNSNNSRVLNQNDSNISRNSRSRERSFSKDRAADVAVANPLGSSRKREGSVSKDKVKVCMEDISNRCREIEERVKNLMEKKKEISQEQRNPNMPSSSGGVDKERKYHMYNRKISYRGGDSREKDNNSAVYSNRSRNNSMSRNNSYRSIEPQQGSRVIKRQESHEILRRDPSQERYRNAVGQERRGRVLSRDKSNERLPSVEMVRKDNSAKKIAPGGVQKNYLYRAPPRYGK